MKFRIKDIRTMRGFTQPQFAEVLGVSLASLSNWELGKRYPPLEAMDKMADVLGVSIDYLLGRTDEPSYEPSRKHPIDLSRILAYHNCPVWLSYPDGHIEEWAFFDGVNRRFIMVSGAVLPLAEYLGEIYAYAPSLSYDPAFAGRLLSLKDIKNHDAVWVEPITPDEQARSELRGWYTVKERFVENEMHTCFYYWNYSSKWLAFDKE